VSMSWCTKIGAPEQQQMTTRPKLIIAAQMDVRYCSGSREKKMTGFYFNKQFKHGGGYTKKEHVPGMERAALKTGFRKIEGNVFPGFPLKAMSHADIIFCCALLFDLYQFKVYRERHLVTRLSDATRRNSFIHFGSLQHPTNLIYY
jgi:hypothetical protein